MLDNMPQTIAPATRKPIVRHLRRCLGPSLAAAILLVVFGGALIDLMRFSAGSDVYSYIILIPVVSAYMAWDCRDKLALEPRLNRIFVIGLAFGGVAVITAYWVLSAAGIRFPTSDRLVFTTAAFLFLFTSVCAWALKPQALRHIAFPLVFLVFMVPLPTTVLNGIETFMQHGSAWVSRTMFELVGTPVFAHELDLQLPGITLHVAPECSGIRSTLVLLITSVLGGYFFLRRPVHRAVVALAVVPIALLRNGLRIFTIGELCVHVGPHMIDSDIHHRGGPIFFAVSLIPFFALLLGLIRRERSLRLSRPNSLASIARVVPAPPR